MNGSGEAALIMADNAQAMPAAWSHDSQSVVVNHRKLDGDSDLMLLTLSSEPALRPLLSTSFNENSAALSADGKLIAYQSNRSGRSQVYVATFPEMTEITSVSVTEGAQPVWASSGRRLYYRQGGRVVTADVSATSPITVSPPVNLTTFVGVIPTGFVDPMPDGRLLMLDGNSHGGSPTIHVILNWFTELREKVR